MNLGLILLGTLLILFIFYITKTFHHNGAHDIEEEQNVRPSQIIYNNSEANVKGNEKHKKFSFPFSFHREMRQNETSVNGKHKGKVTKNYVDDLVPSADLPLDKDEPIVVLFKSEQCNGCEQFNVEWKKAVKLLNECDKRPFCVVIDADHMGQNAAKVTEANNIQTVPSVLVLHPGQTVGTKVHSRKASDVFKDIQNALSN